MLFDKNLGAVYQVRSNLATFNQAQLFLQVFTLAFLHSAITDISDTLTRSELNTKINLVIDYFISEYLHVREQSMSPIPFNSTGYIITRHCNSLPYRQTRNTNQDVVLIVLNAFYLYVGYFIFLRCSIIQYNRLVIFCSSCIFLSITSSTQTGNTYQGQ